MSSRSTALDDTSFALLRQNTPGKSNTEQTRSSCNKNPTGYAGKVAPAKAGHIAESNCSITVNHCGQKTSASSSTTNSSPSTAKPPPPRPKAGNSSGFKMGVVTNNRVAAGSLAGTFDYTLVSGPNGPHNAEIRPACGKALSGPLRQRNLTPVSR